MKQVFRISLFVFILNGIMLSLFFVLKGKDFSSYFDLSSAEPSWRFKIVLFFLAYLALFFAYFLRRKNVTNEKNDEKDECGFCHFVASTLWIDSFWGMALHC